MSARVKNLSKPKKAKSISANNSSKRACVNCIWYDRYYRKNRGNVKMWIPTGTGCCLLKKRPRGAMKPACRKYEAGGGR